MREKEIRKQKVQEDLADLAQKVEQDHEIQLARAELYKAAKYSIKLHDMMKTMSEEEGLEGWVSAKITKASDYLSTVYHHLDYSTKFNDNQFEGREDNPAPEMNKYGLHTTKFKGEPFKVFQHGKQLGEFDTIEEVSKFLTDLVNKESYKIGLQNKLSEKLGLSETPPEDERWKITKRMQKSADKPWIQPKAIGKSLSGFSQAMGKGLGGPQTTPTKIGSWHKGKPGAKRDPLIGKNVEIKGPTTGTKDSKWIGKTGKVKDQDGNNYGVEFPGSWTKIYFPRTSLITN